MKILLTRNSNRCLFTFLFTIIDVYQLFVFDNNEFVVVLLYICT